MSNSWLLGCGFLAEHFEAALRKGGSTRGWFLLASGYTGCDMDHSPAREKQLIQRLFAQDSMQNNYMNKW